MEILGHKRKPKLSHTSVPIFCEPGWEDKRELLRENISACWKPRSHPGLTYKHLYLMGEKRQAQATSGDRGRPSKVWTDNTRL